LSPEIVPLSLFSEKVSFKRYFQIRFYNLIFKVPIKQKRALQCSLRKLTESWDTRTIRLVDTTKLAKKSLHQLVDPSSISAMKLLKLDIEFLLNTDPENWTNSQEYIQMKAVIDKLRVVNDSAERAIALATNFNNRLTKNENSLQQVLQVVSDSRKRLPNANKSTIIGQPRR